MQTKRNTKKKKRKKMTNVMKEKLSTLVEEYRNQ